MKLYKGYQINSNGRIYNKNGSLKKLYKNNSGPTDNDDIPF